MAAASQSDVDAWWAWAAATLRGIGAPTTPENFKSLWDWTTYEKPSGQPIQWNNPLNLTQRKAPYGSWPNSRPSGVGSVVAFSDPQSGASATAQNLVAGYPAIVQLLQQSTPHQLWGTSRPARAEITTWGTNTAWLNSSSSPPNASNNFQAQSGGIGSSASGGGNPVQDALNEALSVVPGLSPLAALSGTGSSGQNPAISIAELAAGVLIMLVGVIILAVIALKASNVPQGVAKVAAVATPQGRAAAVGLGAVQRRREAATKQKATAAKKEMASNRRYFRASQRKRSVGGPSRSEIAHDRRAMIARNEARNEEPPF